MVTNLLAMLRLHAPLPLLVAHALLVHTCLYIGNIRCLIEETRYGKGIHTTQVDVSVRPVAIKLEEEW